MTLRQTLLVACLPLAACSSSSQNNTAASSLYGYSVGRSQLWSSGHIQTCWENGTDNTAQWRQSLQQTVAAAYSKTANVRFTGWGACQGDEPGLHIEIYKDGQTDYQRWPDQYDGHPRALGLGRTLDGNRPGIILNPTLQDVQPNLAEQAADYNEQQIANLQASIVVHELGHVLGLMHEQARPDSPCTDYPDSNSGGGVTHGAYDPDSIMNYCVTHTYDYQHALTLSAGDVTTLNAMYP